MCIPTKGYKPITMAEAARIIKGITGRMPASLLRAKYNGSEKMLWYVGCVDWIHVQRILDCSTGMVKRRTMAHDDEWSDWEFSDKEEQRDAMETRKGTDT